MDLSSNIYCTVPICPHCNLPYGTFYCLKHTQKTDGTFISFWVCGRCEGGLICEGEDAIPQLHAEIKFESFKKVYPEVKPLTAPDFTPSKIEEAYLSALKIFRTFDSKMPLADAEACCVMVRRSLELTVNSLGVGGKTLWQAIEELATRHLITESMKEWAHEIRVLGNDGAHGESVVKKDAEQALYFAEMLFQYLFTLPGMVAERRNKNT